MPDVVQMQFPAGADRPGGVRGAIFGKRELVGAGIKFRRYSSVASDPGEVRTEAWNCGYLLGVSLRDGQMGLVYDQDRSSICEFAEHSYFLRKCPDGFRADLAGPFEFLLMEMSSSFLKRLSEEEDDRGVVHLRCSAGEVDPVLSHLLRAVAPALDGSFEAGSGFLNQLGIAIGTHLIERHSSATRLAEMPQKALLSPSQLRRAKELLRNHLDGAVSITDVARACGLSRGYFIRAFRQATGQTPHRWMQAQRVDSARGLLVESDLSLAEVAIACGFSDQSHFTRVFAGITGATPGSFRRASRV